MALSPDGLTVKRFREIVEDSQGRLDAANTNLIITDESNKIVNNIGNSFCLSLSELYEFVEEVYNSFDVLSAEGVALDRLTLFKNIIRESQSYSTGLVEFTCGAGTVSITPSVKALDTRGRELFANETTTLGVGTFRSFYVPYNPTTPANAGVKYYIVLNSQEFAYTATGGDTFSDVISNISTLIDNSPLYSTLDQVGLLYVTSVNAVNVSVILHPDFTIADYTAMVKFRSAEFGDATYPANTVTTLVTPISGVISINNPDAFDQGSFQETDDELRRRFLGTSGAVGRATVDSILKGVSLVDGVDDLNIINNIEDATSPEGLPPKSFEVIVQGGEDQDIADAILAFAPVGIESFGSTNLSSEDSKGNLHPIAFTRPTDLYIFVRVEYEKYEEFNTFPANGEDLIKQAILDIAPTYKPNQDVIPSSLQVPVYQSVTGLGELRITCGYSTNPNDLTPPLGYSEDRVAVDIRQIAVIEDSRITVIETPIP